MATAAATRTKRKIKVTLDEYLEMPPTKPNSEYVDGMVIKKPMGDSYHSRLQSFLLIVIQAFLNVHPLGEVGVEWRCLFGPPGGTRGLVPDVAFIARERITEGREQRTAPDLAIEVVSRNQPQLRFLEKIEFYLHNGVRLIWVIDPDEQIVLVLQPGVTPRTLVSGDTLDGSEVLPGFSIPVSEIFARLQPRPGG